MQCEWQGVNSSACIAALFLYSIVQATWLQYPTHGLKKKPVRELNIKSLAGATNLSLAAVIRNKRGGLFLCCVFLSHTKFSFTNVYLIAVERRKYKGRHSQMVILGTAHSEVFWLWKMISLNYNLDSHIQPSEGLYSLILYFLIVPPSLLSKTELSILQLWKAEKKVTLIDRETRNMKCPKHAEVILSVPFSMYPGQPPLARNIPRDTHRLNKHRAYQYS